MVVQVNEFHSGSTIRAGTFVLLCSILVMDSFCFWLYLHTFLYDKMPSSLNFVLSSKLPNYRLIGYAFGIIASSIGIVSIHKNKPKFLIFSILYFCCYVVYYIVSMILLIISTKIYKDFIWGESNEIDNDSKKINYKVPAIFAYLFFIAVMVYFASVVKSCMDHMLKQHSTNYGLEMYERKPNYEINK